jgi:hypothetical protein
MRVKQVRRGAGLRDCGAPRALMNLMRRQRGKLMRDANATRCAAVATILLGQRWEATQAPSIAAPRDTRNTEGVVIIARIGIVLRQIFGESVT